MRAVIAQNQQPAIVDRPAPQPGPDELLIQVKATALNRADLLQVAGHYPPPPGAPDILGLELAGEVISMGEAVSGFAVGQRVMALVAGGGYAEQAVVLADHAMPVPDGLSDVQAAAIPEAFLTAYSNMVEIGGLQAGETVLIHAGASGVGLAASQIAQVIGARVIVTASAAKHDVCRQYGAGLTIDYQTEDFAERLGQEGIGVDLVLEMVGAPYWDGNMQVLNKWGRLVFVGLLGGATHPVNFGTIMQKRLSIMGSTLRNRETTRKTRLIRNFTAWALPHFEAGRLRPVVWRDLPLDEVATAHALMRDNRNAGKIVLTLD